jgi:hypothetical protein
VNWNHFTAIVWLRWRLRVNQFKKAGVVNAIVLAVLAPIFVILPIVLFASMLFVGCFPMRDAEPIVFLLVWDGLVFLFLFVWAISLIAELQRPEGLSLHKFMHLPVPLKGVFLLNYLSSLISVNMGLFAPAMAGLALGLVVSRGPSMILLFPLTAAFLLMVTALTYQFQGWLAALMVNPRRRRTVIVLVTGSFILLFQLPNLINIVQPWKNWDVHGQDTQLRKEHNQQQQEYLEEMAWLANLVLPPGWLPLGAMEIAKDNLLPACLGFIGLTSIGTASLWRSYRTTVRLYTGQYTSGKSKRAAPQAVPPNTGPRPAGLLEQQIPWISEQAAAIALAGFRGFIRAPEAKMMLLTPILLVVIFGSMILANSVSLPEEFRPFAAFAGMSMVLLGMIQLLGNQFGFDRSGFRVFVLCSAPREDILLGKNLAVAPMALVMGLTVATVVQVMFPMRVDRFLALVPQLITMYLLVCLVANCLSILTPMAIAQGAFKPANPKALPIILQMIFVSFLPMVLAPALLPAAIDLIVEKLTQVDFLPISLILSTVECLAALLLYRVVLTWQGMWLQSREQAILDTVATKA